jgi:hypothetical protein
MAPELQINGQRPSFLSVDYGGLLASMREKQKLRCSVEIAPD